MVWRLVPVVARVAGLLILALLIFGFPRWLLVRRYARSIYSPAEAPSRPVAIVFGAGLRRDGTPTTVLADRVAAAAHLFHAGKVERLLMSGASGTLRIDEPMAMRSLAIRLGVPADAILIDAAGRRTLDTCLRARQRFGISDAILVTQRFHLPRAIATCAALGVNAIGVQADLHPYDARSRAFWHLRELPATWVALLETRLICPTPSEPPATFETETPHGS